MQQVTGTARAIEAAQLAVIEGGKATNPYITVQYLDEFFKAKPVKLGSEEATRMQVFLSSLAQVDVQSIKSILKDYASKERLEKAGRVIEYDACRTRAKETRQIYGAVRFAGLQAEGLGWDTAYAQAREALKSASRLWDGSPAPTEEQIEKRQAGNKERQRAEMVKSLAQDAVARGETPDYAKIAADAGNAMDTRRAKLVCFDIVKRYGDNVAGLVLGQMAAVVQFCGVMYPGTAIKDVAPGTFEEDFAKVGQIASDVQPQG